MNAVEFSGKIENGLIVVPKEFQDFESDAVRVILLFEKRDIVKSKKENLKEVFNKMKSEKMFSTIDEPVLWQKTMRDEWE